ncbi:dicarboxylate/amino acid:cation symporter [Salinisphaera sp. USBA-960]|nr:dicarboxylate/amino acid:cation symporter [Salifodinibacter halophilus]NNC26154.1 dicarboxylate/amino acid:cation symporter [Salifodinibacter halophilus]
MASQNKQNGFMAWYFNTNLLLKILIGLVLGIITGLAAGEHILWVSPLGQIFVHLLKMIVMPIIVSTLVLGAASVNPAQLGKTGLKIFVYYILTGAIAVAIGLIAGNIFQPGKGLNLTSGTTDATVDQPSLIQTLINVIPTNFFDALSSGDVLPVIFFSILFGIGLSFLRNSNEPRLRNAGETLYTLFDGAAEIMFLIVRWILQYAPIGVFALIAVVFAKQSASTITSLGMVIVAVYLGLAFHLVVVYGGLLTLNKLSFITFLKGAREAMITAFVTRTSSGTLPVTMRRAENNLGINRKVYSFTLPLGATINMDGTAIYQGVCVIFIGFAIGAPLSFAQQVTVMLTAVLASIGTAGVPGAGAIMLLMALKAVGLPIENGSATAAAYAMILGIDALLDMGRTGLNVTGDLTGTTVVAKSEQALAMDYWDSSASQEPREHK